MCEQRKLAADNGCEVVHRGLSGKDTRKALCQFCALFVIFTGMKRPCLVLLFLLFAFAANAQSSEPVFTVNEFKPAAGCTLRTDIYFDLNKSTLRPESKPVLDSLARFLELHNGVTMRINRYGDKYNPEMSMRLGQRRAKTIRDYLISKGISNERLSVKDYGTLRPLVPQSKIDSTKNLDEKQRLEKMNRRTEFEIVQTDYIDPIKTFQDTLLNFVTDSFRHHFGKIPPENFNLRKPFKYIGKDTVFILEGTTTDPHFICEFPKEMLIPGKVYSVKFCFWHRNRRGQFNKTMGLHLNNGQHINFVFTGEVMPE